MAAHPFLGNTAGSLFVIDGKVVCAAQVAQAAK